MPTLRVLFLWHQHQPFYKDLVTGRYRLPWVRLHALKDYYGMVKLLDEFPTVHQTINLVPSLITQLEDYVSGDARDPFFDIAAHPAGEMSSEERAFALKYLFQANEQHVIGRYPRYLELFRMQQSNQHDPEALQRAFTAQDITDLQVLSQIAWFDELFLEEPDIAALVGKGRGYSIDDQKFVMAKQQELISRVLPAHRSAQERGLAELSTTAFYHPILPLLCDTDIGRVSAPGLPLPQRFQHPEDAREQIQRSIALHERVFGAKPQGAWPSEGSVSEEVISIASGLGINWLATDEGVLGRSLGAYFHRDGDGRLTNGGVDRLYNIYRYEKADAHMHMVFRDHSLSDLIGFVYAGVAAETAAEDMLRRIRYSAQPVLDSGRDAVVSIILDGENAWEFYPRSGREFLRRLYDGIAKDPGMEAATVSEAIGKHKDFAKLGSIVPGSWINANFNVWIGAPEDNKAWDFLKAARDFYDEAAPRAEESARKLAYEELLIAEGSDWNWWYGPEHHSANDADFDELYRKHLSNVYAALGSSPPDYLAHPITTARPEGEDVIFTPQMAYIHPRIDGDISGYFDWVGAAMYSADRRTSAMHGKEYVLRTIYAGIDENTFYGRVDIEPESLQGEMEIVLNVESAAAADQPPNEALTGKRLKISVPISQAGLGEWTVASISPPSGNGQSEKEERLDAAQAGVLVRWKKIVEFQLPLQLLGVLTRSHQQSHRINLHCAAWKNKLPIDSLPLHGAISIPVVEEEELEFAV
jgi:alpha-amylase/alpha-mannosidase (GH57 family)